ncbi:MAG TPA: VanW family protein [Candidatus Moranbacteria bacterium]|nr:VanW family protein [Candidatus Moranbacteria bacterium]
MRIFLHRAAPLAAAAIFFIASPALAQSLARFAPSATEKPSLTLTIGDYREDVPYAIYSSWTKHSPQISYSSSTPSEIISENFCPYPPAVCDLSLPFSAKRFALLVEKSSFEEKVVRSFLDDLARRTNREPQDAKFAVSEGRVTSFEMEQPGRLLDVDGSLERIRANQKITDPASETITLPYTTSRPNVASADINKLGIAKLIGEGSSDFKGSPKNRIHNIKVATARFNGVLIKPGEEFSFVTLLGPVDGEHGYLPELVIKQGTTEPEFGGGVCQVSTTAFRAAIYSGLEITARRNHAYPVSYYNPQGMDSTIYVPRPDLKFVNNTPAHILIQAKIDGTKLLFQFYGTDDGRKVEVDGPKIIERKPDGSLKTTFSQKVFRADGSVLVEDTFNSSYDSPYKYPHPGDTMLAAKPANWSEQEWDAYKDAYKAANPPPKKSKR